MGLAKMNVKLVDVTEDPVRLIYAACRQCYSADFAGDIFEAENPDHAAMESFVRKIVSSGHESPLEHVKFTFAVEGVSRALTHQLVRHRIASYSQQSQRYVKETDFDFVIPPSIAADEVLEREFMETMEKIQASYNRMLAHFKQKGKSGEKVNQDIRFVLPQAAETKIIVTMNCRELIHFFRLRCCTRSQWEIRAMADEMLTICREIIPAVFSRAGAKCVELEYCPEDEKFSCGKYPLKGK